MKRNWRIGTLSIVVAALAMSAFAQDGPPREGMGPGGPPMEMRPPRGPVGAGPMLILNPKVAKELRLTDAQVRRLREALRPMGGPPHGMQDRRGRPDAGPEPGDRNRRAQDEDRIKSVLTGGQYKRWQEIELQTQGPMALGRLDVAKKVGLNLDQLDRIQRILGENRPPRPGGPEGQGGPPPMAGPRGGGPDFGWDEAHRAKVDKKVLGVLSKAQLAKWQKLVGTPFKLGRPAPPPRG